MDQLDAAFPRKTEEEGMNPRRQLLEEVPEAATPGERRYSKLEEALEIKSLRRIISAYLKYTSSPSLNLSSRLISLLSLGRRWFP